MQNRFKSPVVWVAILAQIYIILNLTHVTVMLGIDAGSWNAAVNSLLQLGVLFGVLNNPTNPSGF
jgi:uncharacterized membrane protein